MDVTKMSEFIRDKIEEEGSSKPIHVGMKVVYKGEGGSSYDNFETLEPGMEGTVTKHSPEVKGTGQLLRTDDDGEDVYDEGIKEWWTVDFGKAGKKGYDTEDFWDYVK